MKVGIHFTFPSAFLDVFFGACDEHIQGVK